MPDECTCTVLVAIAGDLGVGLAKVIASVFTGSSAVAAAASESLADTANDLFLLLAQRRSSRPADDQHALGYGREAYFWALLAGLGVFAGGAAFSLPCRHRRAGPPRLNLTVHRGLCRTCSLGRV